MSKKSQDKVNKIHFIGIGGIGVSALARYYLAQGFEVSGSDAAESEIVEELRRLGVKIPHPNPLLIKERERFSNIDLVVYSAAVQEDNPELVEARRRGIKCQTYAQALGELTKKYFTIAASGTHGKSTTTAMIGLILETAGLDPTVIVGTKVKWQKPHPRPLLIKEREKTASNFRFGRSKYLVIEADEYAASFLNYWPKIIVLTNIEEDHLDFYTGGLPQILETFGEYISHLGKDGVLVANGEDENIREIIQNLKCKNQNDNVKFKIKNFGPNRIGGLELKIPGRHNLSNAAAAITAARLLNISDEVSVKTLNDFIGTWRRMEYKGEINGAKIYDDYGHHPTEIRATLQGAKELLGGRLWCVFQPHQYQRTYQLFDQFVSAFEEADKVILLPIYSVAGREKEEIKKKINSEKLFEAIKNRNLKSGIMNQEILYFEGFEKTVGYLKRNLSEGDICIIMGAGDIYKLTEKLIYRNQKLKSKN